MHDSAGSTAATIIGRSAGGDSVDGALLGAAGSVSSSANAGNGIPSASRGSNAVTKGSTDGVVLAFPDKDIGNHVEADRALCGCCNCIWAYQEHAEGIYNSVVVQIVIAILIGGNFFANILEMQIDPGKSKYTGVFEALESFFNVVFLLELLLNMYGRWCWPFWRSGWNVFDFVVVSIGVLDTAAVPLPGPLNLLRLMRAFSCDAAVQPDQVAQ